MTTIKFFLFLSILLSCKHTTDTPLQNKKGLFPKMKDINYMKNLSTGEFKPFSFIKTDSLDVSEFDKGIKYQWFTSNYFGQFSLSLENGYLKSKINFGDAVSYNNVLVLKKEKRIAEFPFGGHLIELQKVYFDEKHRDSVYVFNAKEVNTYDVEYLRNDSIEIMRITLSKKRGFLKLLIKEKSTNETYLAKYYPEELD